MGKAKEVKKALGDEDAVEALERQMIYAAEKGDYKEAAESRDKLAPIQLDDEGGVLLANARFYEAFKNKDIGEMRQVWFDVGWAQCIHPYDADAHMHTGYADICGSFEKIFRDPKIQTKLSVDKVHVNVRGGSAVVTCQERLTSKSIRTVALCTSHMFRKNAKNQWKLLHRHASKPPAGDIAGVDEDERLREQVQQFFRATQNLGGSLVIRAPPMFPTVHEDDDDDHDGPFGIGASVPAQHVPGDETDEDSDDSMDLDDEIYAEDPEQSLYDARETIRGLRKLETDGNLSREDKVLLLAEMIENPRENMAERAYGLLLREIDAEDKSAAWRDFADLISLQVKRIGKAQAGKEKDNGAK